MSHVFVSYVHQDSEIVDRLVMSLRTQGVNVWIDREQIKPGEKWQPAIRNAIREGAYFLACFSMASQERARSYMNEELTLAIEELRRRPSDRRWFIPVLLSDCAVPDRSIGAGETLRDIQWVSLTGDYERGIDVILEAISHPPQRQPSHVEVNFIRVDERSEEFERFRDLKISINGAKVGVLSGGSMLKASVNTKEALEIKAECFVEDFEDLKGYQRWIGTSIHEAVLKSIRVTAPMVIFVGYIRGKDHWLGRLLGGYPLLLMRTDTKPEVRSEFDLRNVRGVRLDAFS